MPIHLVLSGSLPLKWGEQLFAVAPPHGSSLGSASFFVSGGGGDLWTSLQWRHPYKSAACCKHTIQAPLQAYLCKKYELGVEEVDHQWADRVLEHLNDAGDKQRVVQ
jgi:hypothetical protein